MYPQRNGLLLSGGYSIEARALFGRMTPTPSRARMVLIDQTIRALKRAGIWAKLDILYLLAAHASAPARANWKSSSNTIVLHGAPVFTTDRGFAGDASAAYLDTGYAPSTGPNFGLNSHAFGIWIRAGTTASQVELGVTDGSNPIKISMSAAPLPVGVDGSANVSGGGTMLVDAAVSRTGATTTGMYANGIPQTTNGNIIAALPAFSLFIGALNTSGTAGSFSGNQWSTAYAGAGLSVTETAALHTILQTYMTGVGA